MISRQHRKTLVKLRRFFQRISRGKKCKLGEVVYEVNKVKDDLVVSDMKAFQNAKKASKNLGVSNSNLNKYSQVLESYGYLFKKEGNKIVYLEKDIIVLKKLKELAVLGGMNINEAANAVVTMFGEGSPLKGTQEQLEVTQELEASKQEIGVAKPKKSEESKKEVDVPKPEKLDKKGPKDLKANKPIKKADNISTVNIESIEEKLDKAINFIVERENSKENLQKIIYEKDLIIAKLKRENDNYQKEKDVINLRDKVLLETIRIRQEERKKSAANLSFWEKRKKG
jgi:hypothetical protein